jgi:glutamate---cysteine ligase / carboxylate-amine ligase
MVRMQISFAESRPSTIGIEWELPLVDAATGDLSPRGPSVIEEVRSRLGNRSAVTHELLTNTVEVVSGVHERVPSALGDLRRTVGAVSEAAATLDAEVMCSGTHPFAVWDRQEITPDSERYATLIDRTRYWGRQMLVWGVHVHVGIDHRDKALPILNAMLGYLPHLQAFSASSPYWGGIDTGYASNRALMFQQLPTAGLPPQFGAWANYEEMVDDMVRTGVIDDGSELRWDLRPSPQWGTIENRVSDGLGTVWEVGAIAALVQCLVTECSDALDAGRSLPTMQPWFVKENKWRAARYGMDAEIITNAAGDERLVVDDVADIVDRLEPIAERLGCLEQLRDVDRIAVEGASYQRQLRVAAEHDGDLREVVRAQVRELRESL